MKPLLKTCKTLVGVLLSPIIIPAAILVFLCWFVGKLLYGFGEISYIIAEGFVGFILDVNKYINRMLK